MGIAWFTSNVPPVRGRLPHGHVLAGPSDRRHRHCDVPVIAAGRNRGRARGHCRIRSGGRRRSTGNSIPGVRGVRRQLPSSPSFARKSRRTHCLDQGIHWKTRSGNPQRLDGGVEPKRNGDLAVPTTTRSDKKPFNPRGGGGPIGSSASVRPAKAPICLPCTKRIGVLQLVGGGSFTNRRGPSFSGQLT